MTRDWLAIYTAIYAKAKYKRLSPIGRGALLHTFVLAAFQVPEATWADSDELRESLVLDGFPGSCLDELIGLGWLETDGEALVIHDWDAHQFAAGRVAQREWEAARKREWRRHAKGVSPEPSSPKPDLTRQPQPQDMTVSPNVRDSPGHVRDTEGDGDGTSGIGEVERLYRSLYHRAPSEGAWAWLASQVDAFGPERVCRALAGEHSRNPSPRDLISRMEKGLKTGDQIRSLRRSNDPKGFVPSGLATPQAPPVNRDRGLHRLQGEDRQRLEPAARLAAVGNLAAGVPLRRLREGATRWLHVDGTPRQPSGPRRTAVPRSSPGRAAPGGRGSTFGGGGTGREATPLALCTG
jgi:hypothetical protein